MKIFLSHSSTDKSIVRKIYEELGASLCNYDEATFDPTGSIPSEIYVAMLESTHFILFASPAAINSMWVQGELERAFESWMKNGIRRAMVFLLDGAKVQDLPDWLKKYVMREPPTYRHILCRIQSEIDKELNCSKKPPFYRPDELKLLEGMLLVETKEMPGAILVHGPDGSGRKDLINELYSRQYPFVSHRKLLIATSSFVTEKELYRDLVGLTTIATPSEFSSIFHNFDSCDYTSRLSLLAKTIEDCSSGGQVVLLEDDYSLLTEDGQIPDWLADLMSLLAGKSYPRFAIATFRRPLNVPLALVGRLITQELPPLDKDNSKILFSWWLKSLSKPYNESLKETVFEACMGSPKQLELGAKLLVAQGSGSTAKIRPHLLKNLESLSRQFLQSLAASKLNSTLLSFVANAGYIVRSDLSQYIVNAGLASHEQVNEAISECASFGFIIEDEVCLRMPNYLVRGARAIGRDSEIENNLKKLFEHQGHFANSLALDEVTSVAVLNEYCLSILRRGQNVGPVFESIILPSQCLQVARSMYDSEKYEDTLSLCKRAYEARAALSQDGLVETLRYMGMAAARLAKNDEFKTIGEKFKEISESTKAVRIENFLNGFKKRLDGKLDEAFSYLSSAYNAKGKSDIHVLRELASVALNIGDVTASRRYIGEALARAGSNPYVIEMAVRVELCAGPADVAKRSSEIEALLDKMHSFDNSSNKMYWGVLKCDHLLALNQTEEVKNFLAIQPYANSQTFIVNMLRARIEAKSKRFVNAQKILEDLYLKTKAMQTGQRQSTLPIICKELVEVSSACSIVDGAECFSRCLPYLPRRVAKNLASEILVASKHSNSKLSNSLVSILNQAKI
ncbi:toll/interleukin-1 receptor domain-containing protein [Chitinimonas sp. JJ19]|uniref:toll/interleukin-1 receptor domain-containing protein n=1 Tax=Chitinimonas sp. JJ19 TaxID=3109352 RepID=UPI0030028002